ncbi:MAG TPA: HD domain-containing phosphohydrolase [Syntrophales bacterium]|nr:HD domain-containing phosphohydrolase [Syntrophales bacterium]HPC31334.1 HD domain-containing phosphohydrolase [Syntrophales bacterium]HQG33240.1 HD domain-containing phosphohydrolase [Syntrophales bacterium]HQI35016.1 HD domain-containing phosphohydrolase [Syntrophales bacterium]HQJ29503.1 HD domain-containing phosphohydrolase [Syntrophales bacterium]
MRLSDIDILKLKAEEYVNLSYERSRTDSYDDEAKAEITSAPAEAVKKTGEYQTAIGSQGDGELAKGLSGALSPTERGIERIYLAAKQYMAIVCQRVQAGQSFPLEQALVYVNNILNSSEDMTSRIYQLTVDYEKEDDYYLSSPVNTLCYGMKVARNMGYEKMDLIEFGLAALLHDIGMFLVPDTILKKEGKLTDEEIAVIRRHPETAVEILSPYKDVYPGMIRAIYEHQERTNGQGYPRGLKGDEISDFAKIIGICDSYEAMTHYRPHKKPLLQTESIKELIGSRSRLFDARIMKAFLDEISIYPVGSYVRLNNRNIGVVTATNKGNPMKPTIRLIVDEKGKKIEPPRNIDLRNYPILNIDRSVSPEEVKME